MEVPPSLRNLYHSYLDAGYMIGEGQTVYGSYFLPIFDASGVRRDTLTWRVEGADSGGSWSGTGAYVERSGMPLLLGAHRVTTRRVPESDWGTGLWRSQPAPTNVRARLRGWAERLKAWRR